MNSVAYKEMYDNELSHAWFRATRLLMLFVVERHLEKDARILDAGCGTGGTLNFLRDAGYKKVTGIDKSKTALAFCRTRGHKTFQGSVNNLPFKDKSFDAVICMDVLYHKGVDADKALGEFRRVLKDSGILYSQEPAFNWLRGNHDVFIETSHRFSKGELIEKLERKKFKVIKSTYFNIILLPIIIAKRLSERFLLKSSHGSDVSKIFDPLNYFLLKVLLIESYLINNFLSFPIGLTIITVSKK